MLQEGFWVIIAEKCMCAEKTTVLQCSGDMMDTRIKDEDRQTSDSLVEGLLKPR